MSVMHVEGDFIIPAQRRWGLYERVCGEAVAVNPVVGLFGAGSDEGVVLANETLPIAREDVPNL